MGKAVAVLNFSFQHFLEAPALSIHPDGMTSVFQELFKSRTSSRILRIFTWRMKSILPLLLQQNAFLLQEKRAHFTVSGRKPILEFPAPRIGSTESVLFRPSGKPSSPYSDVHTFMTNATLESALPENSLISLLSCSFLERSRPCQIKCLHS